MLRPLATFDGVDLAVDTGSGGIFEIANARPGPPYLYEALGGGQVVVPESGAAAIVRGIGASCYVEALSAAREAANRGLDMSLSKGRVPVLLDHHRQPHVVWWRENERTVMKVVSTTPFTIRMSARITVCDKDGNEVLQPPSPDKEWHESLRFYRVSEASGDLFDSFRNLYLAIEALLSDMHPPRIGKTGHLEREGTGLPEPFERCMGPSTSRLTRQRQRELRITPFTTNCILGCVPRFSMPSEARTSGFHRTGRIGRSSAKRATAMQAYFASSPSSTWVSAIRVVAFQNMASLRRPTALWKGQLFL